MNTDSSLQIAQWMLSQLNKNDILSQAYAIDGIRRNFGDSFLYKNERHNYAISKKVLKEFRKLTPNVKWYGIQKHWRYK